MAGRILVGTSSWADPGFVKEWYPPKLPAKQRLPWYAQRFELVELNSSFYAVPDRNTVHGWVEVTPPEFTFDVKAHRALSRHSAPVDSLPPDLRELHGTPELERPLAERLVEETAPLRDAGKFGTYLLQLTPAFSPRRHRLEELDTVVEVLGPHGAGDRAAQPQLGPRRAARAHARLVRGPRRGVRRRGRAARRELPDHAADRRGHEPADRLPARPRPQHRGLSDRHARWRSDSPGSTRTTSWPRSPNRARTLAESAGEVHVAFNNNRGDDAPTAAQRFRALLGQEIPEPGDLPPGPRAEYPADALGAAELEPDALGAVVLLHAPVAGEPLDEEEAPAGVFGAGVELLGLEGDSASKFGPSSATSVSTAAFPMATRRVSESHSVCLTLLVTSSVTRRRSVSIRGGSRSALNAAIARRASAAASGPLPSRIRRPFGPWASIPPVRDPPAVVGIPLVYPEGLPPQPIAGKIVARLDVYSVTRSTRTAMSSLGRPFWDITAASSIRAAIASGLSPRRWPPARRAGARPARHSSPAGSRSRRPCRRRASRRAPG